jgi:RND family efflux transporter MFP subunit
METETVQQAATENPGQRERSTNLRPYVGLALVFFAGAVWVITHATMEKARAVTKDVPGATVAVARIERSDLMRELTVEAEFRPMQEVELHAKVAGFLDKILVDVGDRVEAGQLLAELEIPELKADLQHARAGVSRSDAEVKRAEAANQEAHLAYTRLAEVNKQQPNLLAQQDLDAALSKDLVSASSLAAAQEQVKAAQSEVEKGESLVKYRCITAPFAGVITKRFADPGALIQAGTSSSTQTMPLVRLSDLRRLRLVFPVSVSYVSGIHENDRVRIEIDSLSRTFTGAITRFTHKVDTATRTMDVEVEVPNPDFKIIPGVYASVTLTLEKRLNALVLPVQAVSRTRGNSILVVTAANEVEERTVKLGLATPDKIEVLDGVKEGELVLIGSRAQLRPGQKVTPKIVAAAVTP